MITEIKGDLFYDVQPGTALVNTVNCEGVMGKGIALEFKKRYPKLFRDYRKACQNHDVRVGVMWLWKDENNLIINFPTKYGWRLPSKYMWIMAGIKDLKEVITERHIKDIRIPALGCNNGKLNYTVVRGMIYSILGDLDVNITIYLPLDS